MRLAQSAGHWTLARPLPIYLRVGRGGSETGLHLAPRLPHAHNVYSPPRVPRRRATAQLAEAEEIYTIAPRPLTGLDQQRPAGSARAPQPLKPGVHHLNDVSGAYPDPRLAAPHDRAAPRRTRDPVLCRYDSREGVPSRTVDILGMLAIIALPAAHLHGTGP